MKYFFPHLQERLQSFILFIPEKSIQYELASCQRGLYGLVQTGIPRLDEIGDPDLNECG